MSEDKIKKYEQYKYILDGKEVHPEICFIDHLLKALISTPRPDSDYLDHNIYRLSQPDENGVITLKS